MAINIMVIMEQFSIESTGEDSDLGYLGSRTFVRLIAD